MQGTESAFSSAYYPQSVGQAKALNKSIEGYLRCYIGTKPNGWSNKLLSIAEWCIHTTVQSVTISSIVWIFSFKVNCLCRYFK